jgi:hypothetical protein
VEESATKSNERMVEEHLSTFSEMRQKRNYNVLTGQDFIVIVEVTGLPLVGTIDEPKMTLTARA